ncbi:MAG: endo-1,4-beta-xylanase [Verrucomicrobiota bacterium JB024]|nr:endo-1,4-beta-xylanase [Verrucomicrobiota bacterium JB024]
MNYISNSYRALWNDCRIQERIDIDIERVRKSPCRVCVKSPEGEPLSGIRIECRQITSHFHFGANIFLLDGYDTDAFNERYEDAYLNLFNAATVPFYWKGLEPEQGQRRHCPDSPKVVRRPPPERVIAFCEENGLRMHGHPLVWDFSQWSVPEWLDKLPMEEQTRLWREHVTDIAQRYGERIGRWDVVNEVLETARRPQGRPGSVRMPDDYGRLAFECAQAALPGETERYINEATAVWNPTNLELWIRYIRRLQSIGMRIDGAGLQFHMFFDENLLSMLRGETYTPHELYTALDRLAPLDLPLHISEITLTSIKDDAAGREAQAETARNLYRLWFSHPAVQGITWWNFPDGGACAGEDRVCSGLLDMHLEPKPSYHALHQLIHDEWKTRFSGITNAEGWVEFRGFHGDYELSIEDAKKVRFTLDQHKKATRLDITQTDDMTCVK